MQIKVSTFDNSGKLAETKSTTVDNNTFEYVCNWAKAYSKNVKKHVLVQTADGKQHLALYV